MYKVVQIWPGLIVCKQVTVCPGHIWTTLYYTDWLLCFFQNAFPGNVAAIHILNVNYISKALIALLRPFIKKELNKKVWMMRKEENNNHN